MKPRLFLFRGLWVCCAFDGKSHGLGFTFSDAYTDWLKGAP